MQFSELTEIKEPKEVKVKTQETLKEQSFIAQRNLSKMVRVPHKI